MLAQKCRVGWAQDSRATLFRTPPGPAIQLATKPAFHLVIKSSLNPTEIPLNLTDNPPNLTERIAVSNAALIAKLIASKLFGSKEKDLLKLLNPPKCRVQFSRCCLGRLSALESLLSCTCYEKRLFSQVSILVHLTTSFSSTCGLVQLADFARPTLTVQRALEELLR